MSETPTAPPKSTKPNQGFSWPWLAFAVAAAIVLTLVGIWPYQHWDLDHRVSILGGLIKLALHDSEWIFCLFVPFITAFLVYRVRGKLQASTLRGDWLGAVIFAVGLGIFWIGYKADTGYPGFIAAQLIVLGLLMLIAGREWTRHLFFPWLFLSFMWPLLPLESYLAFPLRMLTANVSAKFLNLIGLAVVREGTSIHSAADAAQALKVGDLFRLDVDEPCSGIRSLYALLMISTLYGYLSLRGFWPRLMLFLSAIPLAMAGNFVRMVLLALGSQWFGMEFAVGRNIDGHQEMSVYHQMAGYAVFAVALAGMFGITTLLEKFGKGKRKAKKGSDTETAGLSLVDTGRLKIHVAAGLTLAVATLLFCSATDTGYNVSPPGITLTMPMRQDAFEGSQKSMTSQEREILHDDVQIQRMFYTSQQRAILATIVLSGSTKRSLHPPEICLPGQGWIISSRNVIPIPLEGGQTIEATVISLFREHEVEPGKRVRTRALNIFWYQGDNNVTCATYDGHVARSYVDAVFRNVNHRWALLSFFVPLLDQPSGVPDPFSELTAIEESKDFIRKLMPQITPHT